MWRWCEWLRLKPPLPVRAKRLAAPRLVFSLGILVISMFVCPSGSACARLGGRNAACGLAATTTKNLLALFRGHDHHGLASFELGRLFDLGQAFEIGLDAVYELETQLLMGQLAALVAQRDLDLVALFQETHQGAQFGLVVRLFGRRPELDLLDLDLSLLLARRLLGLVSLIDELAVVHDLADRRFGVGRHLDEVQTFRLGTGDGVARQHDANLRAIRGDHANSRHGDLFVAAVLTFSADRAILLRRAK